jgi:flagellar motor switch protein FliN/FliY
MSQTPANDNELSGSNIEDITLSDLEKDTLGEIGNICMGTSATTLSTLLGKRVNITTPRVSTCRGNEYLDDYDKPMVATEVSYIQGVDGINVFLLKKDDALAITRVLVGSDDDLDELYLSAISEVMNQMVGSSSTSLADLLHVSINISPPVVHEITRDNASNSDGELLIKTSFRLEIEDLLVSNLVQIMPFEFGRKLVRKLIGEEKVESAPAPPVTPPAPPVRTAAPVPLEPMAPPAPKAKEKDDLRMRNEEKVELKAVKFESFEARGSDYFMEHPEMNKNIDLIIDVPLHVTVVLGKTRKSIKEILEFNRGSIIVLDRLAGEMVDVLVNGKLFAKGEVVVIDDNYGVRITEITSDNNKEG